MAAQASTPGVTAGASTPGATAGASTPGGLGKAELGDLRLGIFNAGLNQKTSFSTRRAQTLSALVDRCISALSACHVLGVNEIHAEFHSDVDKLLSQAAPNLTMMGYYSGDMFVWRPSARKRARERYREGKRDRQTDLKRQVRAVVALGAL